MSPVLATAPSNVEILLVLVEIFELLVLMLLVFVFISVCISFTAPTKLVADVANDPIVPIFVPLVPISVSKELAELN